MTEEAEVFAGVTEAATGDIEASNFCDNARDDEDGTERGQNQQAAAIQQAENYGQAAKDFQPWQVKSQSNRYRPGQNLVVIDVVSEANRIDGFDDASVNENAAGDKGGETPKDIARGQVHSLQQEKTPNLQRPTPNAQWQSQTAAFDVEY